MRFNQDTNFIGNEQKCRPRLAVDFLLQKTMRKKFAKKL